MRTHIDSTGNMKVPKTVCDTLGLPTGGDVELNRDEKGRTYIERAKPLAVPEATSGSHGLDRVRGSLKTDKTTDELMEFLRGDQ